MKKTKIIYWIITSIFAAFMIFTAIPNITMETQAVAMIKGLGYPEYFIPFIGIAKVLGCIAILIPAFDRIKEWAYAGLFFDLVAAIYSIIKVEGFIGSISFLFLPVLFLFLSYFLWHNLKKSAQV